MLRSQLADQRARETQILTAYKQLRDELRKIQAVQAKEKRPLITRAAGPLSASGHGSSDESANTPRHLKRLSLTVQDLSALPRALQDALTSPADGIRTGRPGSSPSQPFSPFERYRLSLTSSHADNMRDTPEQMLNSDEEQSETIISPQEASRRESPDDSPLGGIRVPMTA